MRVGTIVFGQAVAFGGGARFFEGGESEAGAGREVFGIGFFFSCFGAEEMSVRMILFYYFTA